MHLEWDPLQTESWASQPLGVFLSGAKNSSNFWKKPRSVKYKHLLEREAPTAPDTVKPGPFRPRQVC